MSKLNYGALQITQFLDDYIGKNNYKIKSHNDLIEVLHVHCKSNVTFDLNYFNETEIINKTHEWLIYIENKLNLFINNINSQNFNTNIIANNNNYQNTYAKTEKYQSLLKTLLVDINHKLDRNNQIKKIDKLYVSEAGIWFGDEFQLSVNDGGSFLGEGPLKAGKSDSATGAPLSELNVSRKLGFRQRRRDSNDYNANPVKYVIPRSIRVLVDCDGNLTLRDGTIVSAKTISIYKLFNFMKLRVNMKNVYDIYGNLITNPFMDNRRYDAFGNLCGCDQLCDCKIMYEDMFIDLGGQTTDYTDEYYCKNLRPVSGWMGYKGNIKEIELAGTRASSRTVVVNVFSNEQQATTTLINEHGTVDGEPQFRLTNNEVEDVFFQEARPLYNFNRYPGKQDIIWGLRGGKVEDPVFNKYGDLLGGFVVVGPNPSTDRNDVVYYGDKRYGSTGNGYPSERDGGLIDHSPWSDLEVRSPGPEMRFRYPRKNRIYCYNSHGLELMRFQPKTQTQIDDEVNRLVNNDIPLHDAMAQVRTEEREHHEMLIGEFGNEIAFERKWSVHWHGFDLPHEQDGVPFVAQEQPVEVGTWVQAHKPEKDLISSGNANTVYDTSNGKSIKLLDAIKSYFGDKYNPSGVYRSGFSHHRILLGPGIGSHPIYEPRSLTVKRPFISLEDDLQNPTDRFHDQFLFASLDKGITNALRDILKDPITKITEGKLSSTFALDKFEDQVLMSTTGQKKTNEYSIAQDIDGDDIPDIELRNAFSGLCYVFEYATPNTGTRWNHQHYKSWRTAGMGWFSATPVEWDDDIKVWDREYVLEISDSGKPTPRYTVNGNVFPGTIEWLGGWYKDFMAIKSIEKIGNYNDESSYKYKIEIKDEERQWLNPPINHDNKFSNPFNGGPVSIGTKSRSMDTQIKDTNYETSNFYPIQNKFNNEKRKRSSLQEHLRGVQSKQAREYELELYNPDVHNGHQIINTNIKYGQRITIQGTNINGLDGSHFVTQYIDPITNKGSNTELVLHVNNKLNKHLLCKLNKSIQNHLFHKCVDIVPRIMIWRKHKPSLDCPTKQNCGNIGGYLKYNEGEQACMRWINASGSNAHPLHIHGHQWKMIATDGNLNDSPQILNVYFIAVAGTFDGVICCNNPNKQGAWVQHCHNLDHLQNSDNPFPNGSNYPGGMFTNQDYNGWCQKRSCVNHRELAGKLIQMPPVANAGEDEIIGIDCLGRPSIKYRNKVELCGSVQFTSGIVLRNKRLLNHAMDDLALFKGDIIYRAGKDVNDHPRFTTDILNPNVEKDSNNEPLIATRKEVDIRSTIITFGEGKFSDANTVADVKGNVDKFEEPFGNIVDARWILINKPTNSKYAFSDISKLHPLNKLNPGEKIPLGIGVNKDGRTIVNQQCHALEGEPLNVKQSVGYFDEYGHYEFRYIGRGINHEYNGDPLAHKLDFGDGQKTSYINGVMTQGGLSIAQFPGGSGEHFQDGFGFDMIGDKEECDTDGWCCKKKKMNSTVDKCACKHVAGLVRSDTLNEGDRLFFKDNVAFNFTGELVDDQDHKYIKTHGKAENVKLGLFDKDDNIDLTSRGIITHKLRKGKLCKAGAITILDKKHVLVSKLADSNVYTYNDDSVKSKLVSMRNNHHIITHGRSNVALVPGAERGTIAQSLYIGQISCENVANGIITSTHGSISYFIVTDSSNKLLADLFGSIYAPNLKEAPNSACELGPGIGYDFSIGECPITCINITVNDIFTDNTCKNTSFKFKHDFGLCTHYKDGNVTDDIIVSQANPNYSPMKRFKFNKLCLQNIDATFDGNKLTVNTHDFSFKNYDINHGDELQIITPNKNDNGTYIVDDIMDNMIMLCKFESFVDGINKIVSMKFFEYCTLNMPMISYDEATQLNGKEYICDRGGIDPLIRSNAPSPSFVGNGPSGTYGDPGVKENGTEFYLGGDSNEGITFEGPLQRYKGGKLLVINKSDSPITTNYLYNNGKGEFIRIINTVPPFSVLTKLDKSVLLKDNIIPYYTAFEATAPPPSQFMGVPFVPKLSHLGRGKDVISTIDQIVPYGKNGSQSVKKGDVIERSNTAVATLFQFANGTAMADGGPNRFQPGIVPFSTMSQAYTPMWHINFVFLNCGIQQCGSFDDPEDIQIGDMFLSKNKWFRKDRNASQGGVPSPGSGIVGFDPAMPSKFDPFQMSCKLKGNNCPDYVKNVSENNENIIYLNELNNLENNNKILLTEAPSGGEQGWSKYLIVNCPLPVTCDMNNVVCGDEDGLRKYQYIRENLRKNTSENKEFYKFYQNDVLIARGPALNELEIIDTCNILDVYVDEDKIIADPVYFVMTDASDEQIANKYGAIYSPILIESPEEACELDVCGNLELSDDGEISLTVYQEPGRVARVVQNENDPAIETYSVGETAPPIPNMNYSPLKKFYINGKCVVINIPMISWGNSGEDAALFGKQYIVDNGGYTSLIRSIPPSPFWQTKNEEWPQQGPSGGSVDETGIERYKGGQALKIDLEKLYICWKLHKASFTQKQIPYYTVFEASELPPAGFMGVVCAPKMKNLGRGVDVQKRSSNGHQIWLTENDEETTNVLNAKMVSCKLVPCIIKKTNNAVATLVQFGNGVFKRDGGPNRFQEGLVPFTGESPAYTAMWHIHFAFYNCDTDAETKDDVAYTLVNDQGVLTDNQFDMDNNVAFGAVPGNANANNKFKGPSSNPVFDPFQMKGLKNRKCDNFVKAVTGTPDGVLLNDGNVTIDDLINDGLLFKTEAPGGSPIGWDKFLIVNCPLPVLVDLTENKTAASGVVSSNVRDPITTVIVGSSNASNWLFNNTSVPNSFNIDDMPEEFLLVPGDRIVIGVDGNIHGFGVCVLGIDEKFNKEEEQINMINNIFSKLIISGELKEIDAFDQVLGGTTVGTIPIANAIHFDGVVNSGFAGTTINAVCTFHGPNSMHFVLKIVA
jgi:hypothetical protein